ncbi:hypothetical protein PsYK624_157250 [Phanerochaete sordida]|uniref:Uncharacterized protein n=1 Tax=Phanerochaete sordida TaxID=48140 RepID=A0A9P3LLE0_9APHY|nr:hypothetical protein PsYK624_157250 [Phanerochaete sordida]
MSSRGRTRARADTESRVSHKIDKSTSTDRRRTESFGWHRTIAAYSIRRMVKQKAVASGHWGSYVGPMCTSPSCINRLSYERPMVSAAVAGTSLCGTARP